MFIRRLVLVVSIVFGAFLALAVGVLGAGGGLTPGDYSFTGSSANAFFGGKGGPPQPSFSVFVHSGLNSFEPEDNNGGETVTRSTIVQFTEFDAKGVGGSGCFVIPDRDFTVSKNLQNAALHTTLKAESVCPGIGKPVGSGYVAAPVAGSGGGLVLPIKIHLSWSGGGVVSTLSDRFTFRCLDRTEKGTNSIRDSLGGTASGTIGETSGLKTLVADVSSQDGHLNIESNLQPPCLGK